MFQRVEGAALFIAATFIYFNNDFNLLAYVLLLFAFDISMMGYIVNNRVGALLYNIGHSLVLPTLLVIVYILTPNDSLLMVVCLWVAHIGLDRALGFGLKLSSGFGHTHLGEIKK